MMCEIIKADGFAIGAMDTLALAQKAAARTLEVGEFGQQILQGEFMLASLTDHAIQHKLNPEHQSGRQELLENLVNSYLFDR